MTRRAKDPGGLRSAWRVARYRLGSARHTHWRALLGLVLVVGLIGGLGLAALANARRTQSSARTFLASTNPSDLNFLTGLYAAPGVTSAAYRSGYDGPLIASIARLPQVRGIESRVGLNIYPLNPDKTPGNLGTTLVEGSVNGEYFHQDRVTLMAGRLSVPSRDDEVMVNTEFAHRFLGGDVLPRGGITVGVYDNAQHSSPNFGSAKVLPLGHLVVHVVGIVKYNDTVVQDAVDASTFGRILFTPALTRRLLTCCAADTQTFIRLRRAGDLAATEAAIVRLLPLGAAPLFNLTSTYESNAQQTVAPYALALGVFGGAAVLVALLLAALAVGRLLVDNSDDRETVRALGASSLSLAADGLAGVVGALVGGAVLAAIVAVALSPLAPIGPVRPYYPGRGIYADPVVVGLGAPALLVVALASAAVLFKRVAPSRASSRGRRRVTHPSALTRAAAAAGLPAPAMTGTRFALEPGTGRTAVPVRSAIVGVAIAVTVITGTLVFGASLTSLVSHPRLYGWNWNYEMTSADNGFADIPRGPVSRLLTSDRFVAAWSGVYFGDLTIRGALTPVIGARPKAPVGPVILSGHALEGARQVVLGATTLATLHKHLGDTVIVDGVGGALPLTIVGVATLPAVGQAGTLHTSMGTGAYLDANLIPATQRDFFHSLFNSRIPGPQAIWIRLTAGAPHVAALTSLERIARSHGVATLGAPTVESVQRPAQIVNYRSMGATPTLLGLTLVAGAVVALEVTLASSVRRRRRDLALLKTLGFTHRAIAVTVAWQSSVAVALGTIVGVPLGVVAGRAWWTLFADAAHVIPQPAVPVTTIIGIILGAALLAIALAYLPGRAAARTPVALVLRSE